VRVPRVFSATALLLITAVLFSILDAPRVGSQSPTSLVVERPDIGLVEQVPLWHFGDVPYILARDMAHLTGTGLRWRADVGKFVLRNSRHSLKFTAGLRFVVVDEAETVILPAPVRQEVGEVYVPLSVFESLLPGRFIQKAGLEAGRLIVIVDRPNTGRPELMLDRGVTRFTLPLNAPLTASLVSSRASRFVLRVPNARPPAIPGDTLQRLGQVSKLRIRRGMEGLWVELRLRETAASYRLRHLSSPPRIDLEFSPSPERPGFVDVAPEFGPHGGRAFKVLAIDAGHGGADSGFVAASGVREKDYTLALAVAVRQDLMRRAPGVRVVLTRAHDVTLPPPQRAEVANREHADLFLSLHFDGMPRTTHAGITAYVAPPLDTERDVLLGGEEPAVQGRPRSRPVAMTRWHQAAGRHHAEARTAAEHLLASLAAGGYGPSRLRVARSYPTQGVDCPAVLLECGTLSRTSERKSLSDPVELRRLAGSIARAVARYIEGETWP
jgi:N-acetylmuramoyl-L-alanine amidase